MEINDFSHSSFDDIVFEGRNKGYGAYQLRKLEARDTLFALLIGAFLVSALIFGPLIYAKYFGAKKKGPKGPKEEYSVPAALAAKPKGEKKTAPKKEIVKVKMEQSVQYRPREDAHVTEPDPKPDSVLLKYNAGPISQDGEDGNLNEDPGDIGGGGEQLPDDEIFDYVDELPQFKKGEFDEFISAEYVFTEKMYAKGKPGIIYVAFTVEKDGSVTDVKVLPGKGLSPEQDAEAIRVLKLSSGNWVPGKINGHAVRYTYRQPFLFGPEEFE